MSSAPNPEVARRRVFFVPGYDPVPPRKYREIYRRESAEQARISGYRVELPPAPGGAGPFGWTVRAGIDGKAVDTRFEVLVWSDLVRDSMSRSVAASYGQLAATAWIYLSDGTFRRLMRLRKGPVIAALYPVVMLLAYLAVALAAGWFGALGLQRLGLPALPAVAAGAAAFVLVLRGARAIDGRMFVFYLMHLYAFTARGRGAIPPALSDRLAAFAERVAAALDGDADEVLVVGHSLGAHLAIMVMADLLRARPGAGTGPALALLTLGHVVPMVSFLPCAHRLRADLAYLSTREDLTWVDVSAPGDGGSFALCDPVAVSGVAPAARRWPLVVSAAFSRTLSPGRWAALRRRFHRLHFQYLCAFDRPGDYDYFRITAGPETLAARFAGRSPSRSRIETPVSKYTSVAA